MTAKHPPKPKSRVAPGPTKEATHGLAESAAFACALFAAAYWLFRWIQPWVVAMHPPLSPEDFTPWARWAVPEQDGRELPVAFAGMLVCVAACFAIARRDLARGPLAKRPVRWLCFGAAAFVVLSIRSSEFSLGASSSWILVAFSALVLAIAWRAPQLFARRWVAVSLPVLFLTTTAVVLLFSVGEPSINDFGYFIGPALEWKQGEALGSFYMQYSLLGTLITAGFMRLGLHVDAMQWCFAALAILWLALYWWVARSLIRDRVLRVLFLLGLLAFRVLWMRCNIAAIPQVSPFRMELWLPLVLVAHKRGLLSPWTAACAAVIYALDPLFGLLYLGVYVASVAWMLTDPAERARMRLSTAVGILAPIALAVVLNLAVFGSLVAKSATHYMDVKLGFLPIDPTSLFWAVLLIVLLSVVVFARAGVERRFGMFLVLIATAQMTYFFGRSHDHNLVNIGGVWMLVAFVAIDTVRQQAPRGAFVAASVILVGVFGLGSQRIAGALARSCERVVHGPWLPENDFDRVLDETRADWPTNRADVILLSRSDAYLNYRLGLEQHGYFSPVFAHVHLEETAEWLRGEMMQGKRVFVPRIEQSDIDDLREFAPASNATRFMTGHSSSFGVSECEFKPCYELTLQR